MASSTNKNTTVFQTLGQKLTKSLVAPVYTASKQVNSYNINNQSDIIYQTNNKDEYNQKLSQLKQQKLLNYQWVKASVNNAQNSMAGLTNIKLMYRDCDLMDAWPEIGAALDILSEEACCLNPKGKMLNIYSNSDRVKSILEDLFVNRLDIHIILPMICRAMCKYGNNFQLFNIDQERGILGWTQLPVYEIERIENGMMNPYTALSESEFNSMEFNDLNFIWIGKDSLIPYQSWQVSHFRLITDSIYLPYGVSWLHKARRHWRLLSMMEDMMLIYRLERSVEKRVFKIYVGEIDEADVQAYVQDIANNFKRTPVIDPLTGQMDLRKNFLDSSSDYFIPVRDESAANPIDTLPAQQNITSMEDIEYMQNKILSALRIPKTFLNFQEAQGKGQNLSLMDIRFVRTVNRVQQALLMELNKIAMIHLHLLGLDDEITNFTLTMNNPSQQVEMLEIDNLAKKISTFKDAVAKSEGGIPTLSWHRAMKEIMKFSDSEIEQILNELRLESALAIELTKTPQIIKKTGIFDTVDRLYGDPDAEYTEEGEEESGGGGFSGGSGGGSDLLGDIGEPGGDEMGDISGEEGLGGLSNASAIDNNQEIPMEKRKKNRNKIINENQNKIENTIIDKYKSTILGDKENTNGVNIIDKNFIVNEQINNMFTNLISNLNK